MSTDKQRIFLQAYDPHHEALTRYCHSLAYGKMDTEDLVQEVLLSTYQHFEHIRKKDQLLHYMVRAARNISIKHQRRNRRFSTVWEQPEDTFKAQGISPEARVDVHLLQVALQKLPSAQREAIVLFEISGLKMKEIAEIQKRSEAAVKMAISRGRGKLRKLLSEESEDQRSLALLAFLEPSGSTQDLDKLFTFHQDFVPPVTKESCKQYILGLDLEGLGGIISHVIPLAGTKLVGMVSSLVLMVSVVFLISKDSPQNPLLQPIETQLMSPINWADERDSSHSRPMVQAAQTDNASLQAPAIYQEPDSALLKPALPQTVEPIPSDISLEEGVQDHEGDTNELSRFRTVENQLPPPIDSTISFKVNLPTSKPGLLDIPCDPAWRYGGNILALKNRILSFLKNDKIIPSKKGKMRLTFRQGDSQIIPLITYKEEAGKDIETTLPPALLPKYNKLFKRFKLDICTNRVIETTPKYILVGRISPEGVEGWRIKGRVNGTIDLLDLKH